MRRKQGRLTCANDARGKPEGSSGFPILFSELFVPGCPAFQRGSMNANTEQSAIHAIGGGICRLLREYGVIGGRRANRDIIASGQQRIKRVVNRYCLAASRSQKHAGCKGVDAAVGTDVKVG